MNEAIEILNLAIEEHPESAGLYASLGEVYETAEMTELAVESFRSAVEVAKRNRDASLPAFESNLERAQKKLDES